MTIDPNRLDVLALALAKATDLAAILCIRKEILAFLAELLSEATPHAQRAQRLRARTRRRARDLRRRSELKAGEMLASMRDRGLMRTSTHRANLPSLATLGLGWGTAKRWERRAREARQDENHADVTAST
jgi:hypothetical protein